MNIRVIEYQQTWQKDYENETTILREMLGDNNCINIFHIGSTSVPNLKAKPIIDILLVVSDLETLDKQSKLFESLDYEVMGEFGIAGRRYYRKGGDNRTHQIHAFHYTNLNEIERHLIFRDYLRVHEADCIEYGKLKVELALLYPNDIDKYGDGKEQLVRDIENRALEWHMKNRK